MTRFELHTQTWRSCTACSLCQTRKQVVIARGSSIPCDVVFIGEAPGKSENVTGDPFTGQSGHKMNYIIRKALVTASYTLTNLVGCIPLDDENNKTEEPATESIEACAPRVREFIEICQPKLIVCVGKLASVWLNSAHLKSIWKIGGGDRLVDPVNGRVLGWSKTELHPGARIPRIDIVHPSYIIQANVAQQGLLTQRAIVLIKNAVEKYVTVKETA